MNPKLSYILFILMLLACNKKANQPSINACLGHSHNDYEQKQPLHEALNCQFASIEIDIFCRDGAILVAHDPKDLNPEFTLENAYLKPLEKIIEINKGTIYPNSKMDIQFLIDLKESENDILKNLDALLSKYDSFLQNRYNEKSKKPVKVILSGSVNNAAVYQNKNYKYFFLDGRIPDLDNNYSSYIMPLVSTNFKHHSFWDGTTMPEEATVDSLRLLVHMANHQGKGLRFWGTPNHTKMWEVLNKIGVNYISVDSLGMFADFKMGEE